METERVVKSATEGDDESSDGSEEFQDASADSGETPADLTRPSEWTPGNREQGENEGEESKEDATGHLPDSRDYVDEVVLAAYEELSQEEREQKRLEANQYKLEGNAFYKEGKTLEAIDKYTAGLRVCPLSYPQDRAVLYANRGQMKRVLGLTDHAIRNCSKAIELNPEYLKAILRRAEILEETEKLDESLADYQKVLEFDPRHVEANRAVLRLPPKIEARNEKLKQEMMVNLKKLGNMVLNPFGLSTDNFKMEQDPNTGGYNIKFEQNK